MFVGLESVSVAEVIADEISSQVSTVSDGDVHTILKRFRNDALGLCCGGVNPSSGLETLS